MTVDVREVYRTAGQDDILRSAEPLLDPAELTRLLDQLKAIDPSHINDIYNQAIQADKESSTADFDNISPPPSEASSSTLGNDVGDDLIQWERVGYQAIAAGQVAVILLAGGQGTRLGSSDPKGCYDIGLPSRKSLFQLQAERILSLQKLAASKAGSSKQVIVPWYIMTSGPTRGPTEAFFERNAYFGLDKQHVMFFNQGVLPCLTTEGKMMLETKDRLATAPDGNGGIYAALRNAGTTGQHVSVLDDMRRRGIKYVHAYCVDNCLAKVGDPAFVGYCISKNARCGTKVVRKVQPKESVGVVALKGGKWNVIEYSEIPAKLAEARTEGGELQFRAANIANHFYTVDFLDDGLSQAQGKMAYHIARKKIPHCAVEDGKFVMKKPDKPNGMKLEQFIFDVLPLLDVHEHALLEVDRSSEFSPLKNAPGTGSDDPQTSRRDLLQLQRRWLKAAGADIADDIEVEISPLLSYAGEGLEIVKGRKLKSGRAETSKELEQLLV